ncbi:MAG: endolytic transglycosylase MltG [Nitrospirae bacterium]|nr:endolytic transglycosylase MltG [Nitrospirota bacterium]
MDSKMKKNILLMLAATVILFAAYAAIELFMPSGSGRTDLEVEIPEGSTFTQAVNILASRNLIRDKKIFKLTGSLLRLEKKIKPGYYVFPTRPTPYDVIIKLRKGEVIENNVTIIEGDSLVEIGERLASAGILSKADFDDLLRDEDFLSDLDIKAPSLEGYLFPKTYRFPKGMHPSRVLEIMVERMRKEFDDDLKERADNIGLSENETLTLASIIEKEAKVDSERALISAVYHNRIKIGMPLQADPTAIYGSGKKRKKVYKKDLSSPTKYNTYVIKGMPPGPIASPGKKSIVAALYPADVPYIYFVSRGDGSHHFSTAFREHDLAVKQLIGKKKQSAKSQKKNSLIDSGKKKTIRKIKGRGESAG